MTAPRQDKPQAGEHDPALSALYHRAGDIQPPVQLDDAVLAEARRAIRSRRRRWIFPLSTAAVLVIGVGLVLRTAMQPEFGPHPAGIPGALTGSASEPEAQQAPPPARRPRADDATSPSAKPQTPPPQELTPGRSQEERADPPRTRSKASAAPQAAPQADMGMSVEKAPPRPAPGDLPQGLQPEPWLTQIRQLLAQGRRAEAKAQFAAFRLRYPDYPIPEDLGELR